MIFYSETDNYEFGQTEENHNIGKSLRNTSPAMEHSEIDGKMDNVKVFNLEHHLPADNSDDDSPPRAKIEKVTPKNKVNHSIDENLKEDESKAQAVDRTIEFNSLSPSVEHSH